MSRTISHRPLWPSSIAFLLFIFIMLTSTTLRRVGASPYFIPTPDNMTEYSKEYSESLMMDLMNIPMVDSTNSSKVNLTNSSKVNSTNNPMVNSMSSSTENSTKISPNTDVYVIKAVVYEIGILTDTNSTTMSSENSESTERQESINISLYSVPQEDEYF